MGFFPNLYYNCILIAVAHNEFKNLPIDDYCFNEKTVVYDLKGIYNNKKYMRL